MGKWGKWVLLFVVAMVFAVPAWAVDLKLGGKYEMQGRYYQEKDIKSPETGADTTTTTTKYLKHYFNLYPTIQVTDKIAIKGDFELFDNIVSENDSYKYSDKSSSSATQQDWVVGEREQTFDQYSTFTANELYVDATTAYGKFIVGKVRQFSGIGYFIQVPQVPDWTFGLIYNKKNENYDKQSKWGYDTAEAIDGSDPEGAVTNHDLADETHYILIANYARDAVDFKGTLVYKHTGHDASRTRIWYPFFYLNYAFSKDLTFNSKFGFADGPLVDKDSRVAKAGVADFIATANEGAAGDIATTANGMLALAGLTVQTEPDPTDYATFALYQAALAAYELYLASYPTAYDTVAAGYAAEIDTAFPNGGMKKDWEVDKVFGGWLGMGYKMGAFKIQGDFAWLPGGDAPNEVSGYLEDWENFDTWLMNDVADAYGVIFQTPATIAALGVPTIDGNYSFANFMGARLNLAYQFTNKLDANLNFVWAKMENTEYLENWNTSQTIDGISAANYIALNGLDPDALKVGGTGIVTEGGSVLVAAPDEKRKVDDDMGWEVRGRINYALQDNLSTGLDLCYYKPGDLYKNYIENAFLRNNDTGMQVEDTYAARWRFTVKF